MSVRDSLRVALDEAKRVALGEADDDHFYGAWHGGPKAAGGRPATGGERKAEDPAASAATTLADKYGIEFVTAGMDTRAVDDIVAGVEIAEAFAPGVSANVKMIAPAPYYMNEPQRTMFPEAARMASEMPADAAAGYQVLDKVIMVNPLFFHRDKAYAAGQLSEMSAATGFSVGWSPKTDIIHEMGHAYGFSLAPTLDQSAFMQEVVAPALTGVSMYGQTNAFEGFAEAFTLGALKAGGHWSEAERKWTSAMPPDVKARRSAVADAMQTLVSSGFAEADDDDHFYGAWHGGPKAAGGHPVRQHGAFEGRAEDIDFRSNREVAQYLKDRHGVEMVVLDGVDLSVSKEIAESFDDVADYLPEGDGVGRPIRLGNVARGIGMSNASTFDPFYITDPASMFATYDPRERVISLSPDWHLRGNAQQFRDARAFSVANGFQTVGGARGTIYHELGHAVYFNLAETSDLRVSRISGRWAFDDALRGLHVSGYGRTDAGEQFAEAFALAVEARRTGRMPSIPYALADASPYDRSKAVEYMDRKLGRQVREADPDDHYYGPWFGGSKASGGYAGGSRFKTVAEAEEHLRSKHGIAFVNLQGIDASMANEVADAFDLAGDYLASKGQAGTIGLTGISVGRVGSTNVLAEFDNQDLWITLNGTLWSKPAELRSLVTQDAMTLWTVGGRPRNTVLHELGHAVARSHPRQYENTSRRLGREWTSTYPTTSAYGRSERFAEAFSLAAMAKAQGKVDRDRVGPTGVSRDYPGSLPMPRTGSSVRASRWAAVDVFDQHWASEAPPPPNDIFAEGDDDHFYGAWHGGAKAAGGRPATEGEGTPYPGDLERQKASKEEVAAYIKERYGVNADLSGTTDKHAWAVARGLDEAEHYAPGVTKHLHHLGTDDRGSAHALLTQAGVTDIGGESLASTLKNQRTGEQGILLQDWAWRQNGVPDDMVGQMYLTGWSVARYPSEVILHEMGHVAFNRLDARTPNTALAALEIAGMGISTYASSSPHEAFGDAFVLAARRHVNPDSALGWPASWTKAADTMDALVRSEAAWLREADDDHYHGAWYGGSKASGGHAAKPGLPTALSRSRSQTTHAEHEDLPPPRPIGPTTPLPEYAESYAQNTRDIFIRTRAGEPPSGWAPQADTDAYLARGKAAMAEWDAGEPFTLLKGRTASEATGWRGSYYFRGPDGKPVGFVAYDSPPDRPGQISMVGIFPGHQGQGYGTRMYDAIQDTTDLNLYDPIGRSESFTDQGKPFAISWLEHRLEVERAPRVREAFEAVNAVVIERGATLTEADEDDHYHGAWYGGSKASGGHAAKPGLGEATKRVSATRMDPPFRSGFPDPVALKRQQESERRYYEMRAAERGEPSQWEGKPGTILQAKTGPAAGTMYYRGPEGIPVGSVMWNTTTVVDGDIMTGNLRPAPSIALVQVFSGAEGQGYGRAMYDAIQDTTDLNLYDAIGRSRSFTPEGRAFAVSWLNHRIKVEGAKAPLAESRVDTLRRDIRWQMAEADDDHYYGPWFGGSKAAGGRPYPEGWSGTGEEYQQVREWGRKLAEGDPDIETVMVIRDGKAPWTKTQGRTNEVTFTDDEMRRFRDAHIVHNHPSGSGLSSTDIFLTMKVDAASMTATGTNKLGQKVRYHYVRPKSGWGWPRWDEPGFTEEALLQHPRVAGLMTRHMRVDLKVYSDFNARITDYASHGFKSKTDAIAWAESNHQHEVYTRMRLPGYSRHEGW